MIIEKIQKDYPNALCEREWRLIMPHLPEDSLLGRPREHSWREIIDGIFYILRSGCPWRYMPHDLPPWQSVYRGFRKPGDAAFWQKLNESLSVEVRLKEGRKTTPSAGVIDSQTIKSTHLTLLVVRLIFNLSIQG